MSRAKIVNSGWLSMAVSLVLCVACGGSSSSGSSSGGSFSSAVPGDQKLGTISDADESKLCSELGDYLKSSSGQQIVDFSCRFSALFAGALTGATTDADLQKACQSSYDQCTAGLAASGTQTCTKPPASCNATVAELEACLNDSGPYYAKLSSSLPSCATVKLSDLSSSSTGAAAGTPPQSCATYETNCPSGSMLPTSGSSTPL